jgi:hypothetical protein
MTIETSSVSFSDSESTDTSDSYVVTLEQDEYDSADANYADVQQMLYKALNKESAFNVTVADCPLFLDEETGVATVYLVFYVLLSDPDIVFTLESNVGTVSYVAEVVRNKEQQVIFELSDTVEFDYIISDVETTPESPAITSIGDVVDTPTISVTSTSLTIPDELFFVAWASISAPAKEYQLVLDIASPETGYEISSIAPTVIATWTDADGETESTTLELTVPDCVYDSLSTCSDGSLRTIWTVKKKGEEDLPITQVYYNTCNGKVLGTRVV